MMRRIAMVATVVLAALGASSSTWAQGCVLCYTSAAAGGAGAMRAFEFGMLTLLVPALVLFGSVVLLIVYRARTAAAEAKAEA